MSDVVRSITFQTPQEYYAGFKSRPNLQKAFCDIDDEINLKAYLKLLKDSQTRNFVLDFGNDDAWCAVNLDQGDVAALLRKPVCVVEWVIAHMIWNADKA